MNLTELPEAITTMQMQIKELQDEVTRLKGLPVVERQCTEADIIINLVAKEFRTTRESMMSLSRFQECVVPRMLAMWLIRHRTKLSSTSTGQLFSRDHGTVLSAVRKINDRISTEPIFHKQVDALLAAVDEVLLK